MCIRDSVGSNHLGEDVLTQRHLAGVPNGPAFSAIFGSGTDKPVSTPLIQFKRLDNHRIRKAVALNGWFEISDRIYGLAVTLRDSSHQNSGCRDALGEEKTTPIHVLPHCKTLTPPRTRHKGGWLVVRCTTH